MAATDDLVISIICSGPGGFPLLGKTGFNINALTAANIVAQSTAATALKNAVNNLSNGSEGASGITHGLAASSGAYPSAIANRGQKWIITAQATDGTIFTYTIPAANPTGNVNADNITANLASSDWAAFLTAFGNVAVSPTGLAMAVLRAKLGGRRR